MSALARKSTWSTWFTTGGGPDGEGAQRHLHQDHRLLPLDRRLLEELRPRPLEQIEGELRDGAEAAALDQDGLLVEHLRGLDDLPGGGEHRRVGQPLLDQLQAHEPVVHPVERRARELDHVHVDPLARELVHERADQRRGLPVAEVGAVDQVDAQHAERLLLARGRRVLQVAVDDDVGRRLVGPRLEADADPAAAGLVPRVAPRGDGVGESEEGGAVALCGSEPLEQLAELVLEHGLQALAADVTLGRAVDRVADGHVIGRDALGDRARGAAYKEEPARHLLSGADLGDGAVLALVEVERQGFLPRAGRERVHWVRRARQADAPVALASWRETRCA